MVMSQVNIGLPDEDSGIKVDYATTDQAATFTKRLFGHSEPYERFVNIFGDVSYTWDKDFIDMLIGTLNTGIYDNKFNVYEKSIAEDYVAYKYETNGTGSELIIALDEHLGAL